MDKFPVNTRRCFKVVTTLLTSKQCCINVKTTSFAYWVVQSLCCGTQLDEKKKVPFLVFFISIFKMSNYDCHIADIKHPLLEAPLKYPTLFFNKPSIFQITNAITRRVSVTGDLNITLESNRANDIVPRNVTK